MVRISNRAVIAICILAVSAFVGAEVLLDRVKLPPGFHINVYAEVPHARSMSLSPSGIVYVAGWNGFDPDAAFPVYALLPQNCTLGVLNCTARAAIPITEPFNMTAGVEYANGDLYVAQNRQIWVYRNIEANIFAPPAPVPLMQPGVLPDLIWHNWRYIRMGPDGYLYVTVGSPCNVPCDGACDCADAAAHPLYGTILRVHPQTGDYSIVLRGVRNSVGISFHPTTGELWFTDNGRDEWNPGHENRPPDELNRLPAGVPSPGPHFGFPYCYGFDEIDTEFNTWGSCSNMTGAERQLGPHVAALGFRFYTGASFPDTYRDAIFIAEHGSWDRQPPIGYRVSMVSATDASVYSVFLNGFLPDGQQCNNDDECPGTSTCQMGDPYVAPYYCSGWARPADVQVMPDGALLVSDDQNGVVYRVSFIGVPWYHTVAFYGGLVAFLVVVLGVTLCLVGRMVYKRSKYAAIDEQESLAKKTQTYA